MIKNKNKIIVFIVFAFLIVGSLILINNNDIKISNVSSKGKKYNAVNPADARVNNAAQCNAWYDNIENQYVSYKDVVGETSNLFIVNHCAWNPYDIAIGDFSDENKKTVCDMQKEFIEDKQISYSDAVNTYNASKCKGISGELTVSYDGKSCSALKTEIEKDFVGRYGDYVNYFVSNCKGEVGDIDKSKLKPYKVGESCESLKLVNSNGELYTGILERNGTVYETRNQCNYSLYYLNGGAVDFKYYLENVDDNNKKAACENMRNLIENGTVNDDKTRTTYDNQCLSISGQISSVESKYITFDATSGYGIECSGYAVSNGVCRYEFKYNATKGEVLSTTITLPDVTNTNNGNGLYELGTGRKFSYWSKNNTCSTKDILVGTGSIEINNSNYSNYDGTYYACYSDNASDTVETITDIHKTCADANDYQATLTSTIKSTDNYTTNSNTNDSITHSNKIYTINKYCPMKCSETFTYTYPSIFETVKSGTYFQLIYTPQVKSTYKCTQTFNYDLWKNSYNIAIDNEKKAYVDYQNAEGINAINSPSDYGSEDSSCGVKRSWSCGTREHPKTCYEFYKRYTISFTPQVYSTSSKTFEYGTNVSVTYCENDNISIAKSSLFNQIYQQLDTTKKLSEISADTDGTYVVEKGKRQNLENMNKTCFNTLSTSSVSTEKFYSVKPNVSIKYDLDTTIDNEVKLITDDPYYSNDNLDRKDVTEEYNISYGSTNEKFNAYTFGDNHITTRTKKVNYEFHTNFDYYTNFYTGSIVETYNNKSIKLGNVFPVKIASSGTRNIKFVMDTTNSNLSGNVKNVLKSGDNATYTCTYKITNDAVVLDKETKDETENNKKYKTTFFVRPIATSDVDPNNRLDKGLLGANWSSTKGQALMKIIEDKSKNQNTYNPNNLEYSFTLNANTLDQIREYNKLNKYDNVDWSTNCNGLGMECESKFLNGLSNGSLGTSMDVNGVNAKLTGRKNRKYYINGQWITLDKLTSYTGNECSSFKENESNYYDCLYRKVNEGVTP